MDSDFHVYGYVLKHITATNPVSKELELHSVVVFTNESEYVVIDTQDRNFILPAVFPSEGSFIYFQNLEYVSACQIEKKDLKFKMLEDPSQRNSKSDEVFTYSLFRLCVKSCFNQVPPNKNEYTETLKLVTKDKKDVTVIKRHVKYILGQGLNKQTAVVGGECFTQIPTHHPQPEQDSVNLEDFELCENMGDSFTDKASNDKCLRPIEEEIEQSELV